MIATVAQLVDVRSQLAVAIESYYLALIGAAEPTPWFRPGSAGKKVRVMASSVTIPARVLKEDTRPKHERDEDRRDEPERRPGINPNVAHLYEEPGRKNKLEADWAEERPQIRRAVILGAPGGGKTFLTQTTILELAREGLEAWGKQSAPLDALPMPIWLQLNDLAIAAEAGKLEDVLAGLVLKRCYKPALKSWVLRNLASENCWLILDALDQVKSDREETLNERLESIETARWQCRIVLTCRKANYDRQVIPWGELSEFELAPFQPVQNADFIMRRYGAGDERGEKLRAVVERSYSLQVACRTPLMSTLACLANETKPLTEDIRRCDLYDQVLRDMLRKAWHQRPLSPSQARVEDMLEMLRPMAWELFMASPEVNQFPNSRVKDAIATGARESRLPGAVTSILDKLVDRGILVEDTPKTARNSWSPQRKGKQFSFPHRSFHEFLVADYLSGIANKQGWEKAQVLVKSCSQIPLRMLVDKKSWSAEWQEVMILLAGNLNDPNPLLELLKSEETDDLYRHRLALSAQCVGDLPPNRASVAVINELTAKTWAFYSRHSTTRLSEPIKQALPALAKADGEIAPTRRLLAHTMNLLRDPDWRVQHRAEDAVELMGVAAARVDVVDRLLESLRDPDARLRRIAADALGRIGPGAGRADVVNRLVECLRDPDSGVRESAANTLGTFGPAAARADVVQGFLEYFRNPYHGVLQDRAHAQRHPKELGPPRPRWMPTYVLWRLVPAGARAGVVNQLAEWLQDRRGEVRMKAADALGQLGPTAASADVVDRLVESLWHPNNRERERAADALGKLGMEAPPEVVDQLAAWLRDRRGPRRASAARALGRMGRAAARQDVADRLVNCLRDPEGDVRMSAADALSEIGLVSARPKDLVDELLRCLLEDPEINMHYYATQTLGRMGRTMAHPEYLMERLVQCLHAPHSHVRSSAEGVLECIGSAAARPDIVDLLLEALRDPDLGVRSLAQEALGSMGALVMRPDVVETLVGWLRDPESIVRVSAAYTLGKAGSVALRDDIVDRLVASLAHPEEDVRSSAAYALGPAGQGAARRDVLDGLAKGLRDPDIHVRASAATALGELGPAAARPDVVERLIECLRVVDGAEETVARMRDSGARFFRSEHGLTVAFVRDLSR